MHGGRVNVADGVGLLLCAERVRAYTHRRCKKRVVQGAQKASGRARWRGSSSPGFHDDRARRAYATRPCGRRDCARPLADCLNNKREGRETFFKKKKGENNTGQRVVWCVWLRTAPAGLVFLRHKPARPKKRERENSREGGMRARARMRCG